MNSGLFPRLADATRQRPAAVWTVVALITAGAALLLPKFRLNPDFTSLFPERFETAELLRALPESGEAARALFVVLRGEPGTLNQEVPRVADDLRRIPGVEGLIATREDFASRRRGSILQSATGEMLDRLEDRLAGPGRRAALEESKRLLQEDPVASKEIVRRDPLGLRWIADPRPPAFDADSPYLVFSGGRLGVIILFGREEPFHHDFAIPFVEEVERRAGPRAEVIGGYVTARDETRRVRSDLIRASIWSAIFVFAFLAFTTRSLVTPLVIFVPVLLGIFWTVGYAGALLGPLTPLVVASSVILIGLGADYPIYYLSRFRAERTALPFDEALRRSHSFAGRAILGMTLATSAAFLTYGLTTFRGLGGFGILHAAGLGFTLIATLLILPYMIPKRLALAKPIEGFSRVGSSRGSAVILLMVGLAAWAFVAIRGVRFTSDPRSLRPRNDPNLSAFLELEKELALCPVPMTALVDASEPLESLNAKARALEAQGTFARVEVPLPPERLVRFRERTRGWVEGTLRELEELRFQSEPFRAGLERFDRLFSAEPEPAKAFERKGRRYWVLQLFPKKFAWSEADQDALADSVRHVLGSETRLVGAAGLTRELTGLLWKEMLRATGATAVLVYLFASLFTGGPVRGLLALLPAASALGMTLAGATLLGAPLHLVNVIALPLILGIGIDAGINIVAVARMGAPFPPAAQGVWLSAMTTALAFASLGGCESPGLSSLGLLAAMGLALCLLLNLFMLPPFLTRPPGDLRREA